RAPGAAPGQLPPGVHAPGAHQRRLRSRPAALGCRSRRLITPRGWRALFLKEPRCATVRTTKVSLLDALVFGSAGVVLRIRGHHREPGCALHFGNARRPRGARRTISQLAVLKIELTLGARAVCGQSSVASVRGDDHCCAFPSFLPRDPALPTTCELL